MARRSLSRQEPILHCPILIRALVRQIGRIYMTYYSAGIGRLDGQYSGYLRGNPSLSLLIDYTHALPRNTFAPLEKAQYLKDLRTLRIPPEDAIDVVRKGFANPYWEVRRESVQFLSHFGNTEL